MGFGTHLVAVTVTLSALASLAHAGHAEGDPVAVLREIGDVGDVSFAVCFVGVAVQSLFNRAVALLLS